MSENKPLTILKTYHKSYQEYQEAYDNLDTSREKIMEDIRPYIEKQDSSDGEFKNLAKEILKMRSIYPQEVSFSATKFLNACDFYKKYVGEELPEDIDEDYSKLKMREYKHSFSVKEGQFIRNSKVELPEIPQKEFDFLMKMFREEM